MMTMMILFLAIKWDHIAGCIKEIIKRSTWGTKGKKSQHSIKGRSLIRISKPCGKCNRVENDIDLKTTLFIDCRKKINDTWKFIS